MRARRGRFAVMVTLILLFFGGYWLIADDALLPDEVLVTLVPRRWADFRDEKSPVAAVHPFLLGDDGHEATRAVTTLKDIESTVARWNSLEEISSSLGVPAPPRRPRKAWNGHRGVFLVPQGDGNVARYDALQGWWHYRLRKQVVKYVVAAIGRHVRADPPTLFHLGVDDNDVFHALMTYPKSSFATHCWSIIRESPFLYFIHWNPTMVDPSRGLLGPRMIPIPDYEHIYVRRAHVVEPRQELNSPVATREHPVFRWRGGTTGAFHHYNDSDRYRVVKLMHTPRFMNVSDVKFDAVGGESVVSGDVPTTFVGPSQSQIEMSQTLFHLDLDGNGNSWRGARWKLASGIPVIKNKSPFVQWYYPLLRDGEHLLMWDMDDGASNSEDVDYINKEFLERLWEAASQDYTAFAAISRRAGEFASEIFHRKAAEGYIFDAFQHLPFFESPRDWRIGPSVAEWLSSKR